MATIIHPDPDILGGTPVFRGTRVPVESLFDHLAQGVSLDDFLDDFPSVEREQAVAVLLSSSKLVLESSPATHRRQLRYEEKICLLEQASNDPLFLADMYEVCADFRHI